MQQPRISSLHLSIGVFSILLGALALVAPHRLSILHWMPGTAVWVDIAGLVLLLSGSGLLMALTFPVSRWIRNTIYLVLAVELLTLSWALRPAGLIPLGVLALAMAWSLFGEPQRPGSDAEYAVRYPLLLLALGFNGLLVGGWGMAQPAALAGWVESHVILALGGLSLIVLVFWIRLREPWYRLAFIFAGSAYLIYFLSITIAGRNWPLGLFYGGFGLLLFLYPWIERPFGPGFYIDLRIRLGTLITIGVALLLILLSAVTSQQVEDSLREETLYGQQIQAQTLARAMDQYIQLHRSALVALAETPNLSRLSLGEQRNLLHRYANTFPDVSAFSLFGRDGRPIVRSDELTGTASIASLPLFQEVSHSGRPGSMTIVSPVLNQPMLMFGAPVLNSAGDFDGLATFNINATRLFRTMANQIAGDDQGLWLVDERGQVLSHDQPSRLFTVPVQHPAVAQIIAGMDAQSPTASGSLRFDTPEGEMLAGYAWVPSLGWGVISERPSSVALEAASRGRDLAYFFLLFSLFAATGLSWNLGYRISRPIRILAEAFHAYRNGDPMAPIPVTRIVEVQTLAESFADMRLALEMRTQDLLQAQDELQKTNQALEDRVVERTQALQRELAERVQVEKALQENRALFLETVEAAEIGIWQIQLSEGTLRLNNRAARLLQLSDRQEAQIHDFLEAIVPEDRPALEEALETARTQRTRMETMIRIADSDGGIRWLLCSGSFTYAAGADPTFVNGILVDVTRRRQVEEEMRQAANRMELQHYLTQSLDRDRTRIAQEFHDGPLQDLVMLSYALQEQAQQLVDTNHAEEAARLVTTLSDTISKIRDFMSSLRPPTLDPFGLERAIRSHTDLVKKSQPNLLFHLDLQSDGKLLAEPVRLALYQVYRESVQNVIKHANATELWVKLRLDSGRVQLDIEDNGHGLQQAVDYLELARQGHLGLVGCRERAEAIGGTYEISAWPGQGVHIRVCAPFNSTTKTDDVV